MKQNQPKWIWLADVKENVNQYVEFYKEFELTKIKPTQLLCSVDTDFVAYVNDKFVGTGQFTDFPDEKTFSRMDITNALVKGKNTLKIIVHYCGVDHFSYIPDKPALWFKIESDQAEIISDEQTLARPLSAYKQGNMPKITPQLGFVFEYDANKQQETSFKPVVILDYAKQPTERPIPMLTLKPRPAYKIIAQGIFKRIEDKENKNITVAQLMQRDFLSARHHLELFENVDENVDEFIRSAIKINPQAIEDADGAYVIVDLGREECGFIDIELDSSAGTIVDIAIGEHTDDMRVRASIGGRNFASRYISSEGRNRFTHFMSRYAGRYLQLHITNITSPVILYYAGLIPAEYPVELRGKFNCSDSVMNKIFEISNRTLHLCMHEHYEDCPWREQALYGEDSRIQALVNYYVFGEYEFSKASFDLLGKSVKEDGYIELCAPMRYPFTIPLETMAWLIEIAELFMFSGDFEYAKNHLPKIQNIIDIHLSQLTDNLLACPRGKRYWHFYDWEDGLSGSDVHPNRNPLSGLRFDAILNFFFVLALRKMAKLAQQCNEKTLAEEYYLQADKIVKAADKKFWNETQQAYVSYIGEQSIENHFAEFTQALAILCGLPSETSAKNALLKRLISPNNCLVPTTLSASIYKYDALLSDESQSKELCEAVLKQISENWGKMVFKGATSFWETIRGADDFDGAGSLCHGWSAVPAYIYQAYLLGIKPLEPGFGKFQVNPIFANLSYANGTVPTPAGNITVSWEKIGQTYNGKLTYPSSLTPIFADSANNCDWNLTAV